MTILAIEEPEAHLHPVNQRLIYKDVIKNSNNSVLLTTHSTHITSIAPIESIVHHHEKKKAGTVIHATTDMPIATGEFLDVGRYLDVKRGEIYLGKAVILVEGIAEEYLSADIGYLGIEIITKLFIDLDIGAKNDIPGAFEKQEELFDEHGFFVGTYIFEVDMMEECKKNGTATQIFVDVFNELTSGVWETFI